MFPELHAIERVCTRTPGSLKRLVLIDPDDLASTPDWHLLPSIEDLSFLSEKGAYDFQDDRLTARLEDSTEDSAAGDFFSYTLTARLRTVRAEVEYLRAKLRNRRVHVVATYYNGEQRYIPYMRLRFRADSADRPGGRNGYQVTGLARLLKPAPFLNADIEVIGGPYVPPDPGEGGLGVTLVELSTDSNTYSYSVPTGKWLDGIEIRSTDAQTIKVGTSAGGEEISGFPVPLDALETYVANGAVIDTFGTHTIHFTDLEGTNSIRIWLLG